MQLMKTFYFYSIFFIRNIYHGHTQYERLIYTITRREYCVKKKKTKINTFNHRLETLFSQEGVIILRIRSRKGDVWKEIWKKGQWWSIDIALEIAI